MIISPAGTTTKADGKHKYTMDEDGEMETSDGESASKKSKDSANKKGMKQSYTLWRFLTTPVVNFIMNDWDRTNAYCK